MIPHARIRSALRSIWWQYSPDRKAALKRAKWNGTKFFRCEECHLPTEKPEVDHRIAVGPTPGSRGGDGASWDGLVNRLFCSEAGLRVLCAGCHKNVTSLQREKRKDSA